MRKELRAELEYGKKLYPDLKENESMLSAILQAESDFYRDHPGLTEPVRLAWTAGAIRGRFLNDESLDLGTLALDLRSFQQLLAACTGALSEVNPASGEIMEEIKRYAESYFPVVVESVNKEDIRSLFDRMVKETSLERDLATFLFQFTVSSLFQRRLNSLLNELDTSPWRRGDCPVCEEKPHYGLLRKEDGAKMLECWLCGTRWRHTRVMCPFCGNLDHEKMGLFTAPESDSCRVHFCKSCSGYYKIFDLRKHQREDTALFILNMGTLSHDLLALKEGFSPGSGLEWIDQKELSSLNNQH